MKPQKPGEAAVVLSLVLCPLRPEHRSHCCPSRLGSRRAFSGAGAQASQRERGLGLGQGLGWGDGGLACAWEGKEPPESR